jgi:hypothetical protein
MNRSTGKVTLALVVAVLVIGISGCPNPEHLPVIYAAGYRSDGTKSVACYWAGTTRTNLPGDGTHEAYAFGIWVE